LIERLPHLLFSQIADRYYARQRDVYRIIPGHPDFVLIQFRNVRYSYLDHIARTNSQFIRKGIFAALVAQRIQPAIIVTGHTHWRRLGFCR
jgi:hypothetical protein